VVVNEQSVRRTTPLSARLALYLAGICGVGIGVGLMVEAELGLAPNDVLSTGLGDTLSIGVGTAAWIIAAVAIALAWILGRRPRTATVLGGVVVGFAINAALDLLPTPDSWGVRAAMLVVGLVIIWLSITTIVAVDVGAGPLEMLMLAIMDKNVSIHVARWGIEIGLFVLGILLGGDAGLGTIIFAVLTGPILAFTLPRATALLGTSLSHPAEIAAAGP
jgi:uncharacterized membrane protein YczE